MKKKFRSRDVIASESGTGLVRAEFRGFKVGRFRLLTVVTNFHLLHTYAEAANQIEAEAEVSIVVSHNLLISIKIARYTQMLGYVAPVSGHGQPRTMIVLPQLSDSKTDITSITLERF